MPKRESVSYFKKSLKKGVSLFVVNLLIFGNTLAGSTHLRTADDWELQTLDGEAAFTVTNGSITKLKIFSNGTVGAAHYCNIDGESCFTPGDANTLPLIFSTGLTRTVNTVTVNQSQNINNLYNLTTNGLVRTRNGDGTLIIDTSTYLTENEPISLSGDLSGSGTTSINATIGNSKVTNAMLAGSISDTKISSAANWNAKENALTFNSPFSRSSNTISLAPCSNGQILKYNGSTWDCDEDNNSGSSGVSTGDKGDVTVSNSGNTWSIDTGAVTNAMLSGSIANSKLSNSSVTLNGTTVALGASATITANTTNTLTIGSGLSGSSFNGSSAVTIAMTSCPTGQILKSTGSGNWGCNSDNAGSSPGNAQADDSNRGVASFHASDFESSSGNIFIDYNNAQSANATQKGFLTSSDWNTFNSKGDLSSGETTSVDNEIALFSGTTGKVLKRAPTLTGLAKITAGVLSAAIPGTDYVIPTGLATGQTIVGSSGSDGGLTLQGNSNTSATGGGNIMLKIGKGSPARMNFNTNSSGNILIYAADSNGTQGKRLQLYSLGAGAAQLTLDTTGNVGLGTTTPDQKFEIVNTISRLYGSLDAQGNLAINPATELPYTEADDAALSNYKFIQFGGGDEADYAQILSGPLSNPEGLTTATGGSLFLSTSGKLFLKNEGFGNTGWMDIGSSMLTLQNTLTIGSGLSGTSFNGSSPVTIALDYTNGTSASAASKGFLTAADWNTFNNKLSSFTETGDVSRIGDCTTGDCTTGDCFTGTSGTVLTFKGASSGTTALQPATTASGTLTLPTNTGTLISTGDTGSVSNTMLAGSITDAKISSAATWNAKENLLTFNAPLSRTANAISLTQSGIDHGSIGGLTDDDHTQYALLAGRSSGQTLVGSTGAGGGLTLHANSNASATAGGNILFKTGSGTTGQTNFSANSSGHTLISSADSTGTSGRNLQLYSLGSDPSGFSSSQFVIATTGNIGIHTTSPDQSLDIANTIDGTSNNYKFIQFSGKDETNYGQLLSGSLSTPEGNANTNATAGSLFLSTAGKVFVKTTGETYNIGWLDLNGLGTHTATQTLTMGAYGIDGNTYDLTTDGSLRISGTQGGSTCTTNGLMRYDTSNHKFQGCANGSWVNLH